MNKMKKVLAATCAFALAAPMFATPVFALEPNTKETNVSYDNTSGIPDPDHPDQPGWAVTIPSSITLTDGNTLVNADVELIKVHGGDLPTKNVTVTVTSKNDYLLKIKDATTGQEDPVPYVLAYAGKTMTAAETGVGTLNATTTKIQGAATLNGTAQKTGSHIDILTYKISVPTV